MLNIEPKIRELLEELSQEFIDKHDQLDMRATGQWVDSVEIESSITGGKILANDYTEQLVQGRRPGSLPPIDPIERWVNAKLGISGKEGRGVAWGVAKKIQQSGTTWHQQGGSDLIDGVFDRNREQKFIDDLGTFITGTITDILQRDIQKIFA